MNKIKIILGIPLDILQCLVCNWPGKFGNILRYMFWRKKLKYIGKNAVIDTGVYFQNPKFISLNDNCWIDKNVIILAGSPNKDRIIYDKHENDYVSIGEVIIGKNTHIAPNCVLSGIGGVYIGNNTGVASNSSIYSFSHHYRNLNNKEDKYQYSFTPKSRKDQQAMILSPVIINDYCAIGLNSVVLPGTELEKGVWVASGSVISGKYEEQSVVNYRPENNIKKISHMKIKY